MLFLTMNLNFLCGYEEIFLEKDIFQFCKLFFLFFYLKLNPSLYIYIHTYMHM